MATKGLLGLARRLPRRAGFKIFSVMGGTAGYLLKKDRKRALENLEIAFPDMPLSFRKAMANAMFKSLGRNAFEFLNLEGGSKERVMELVERVDGLQHFADAFDKGQGVIAVTGHIGCWELLAAYFVSRGYPVNVVGRELWEKRLNRELIKVRESMGYRTIDRDTGGREMVRVLRDNRVLAVLMDQHTRVSGIFVPFFDRPAHTPTGVARLAQATGAAIVPMAIYMTRPGVHHIRVLPPIEWPQRVSRDREIEIVTERCSRAIEDLIRFDPKQWVWFHRRWREPEEVSYAAVG